MILRIHIQTPDVFPLYFRGPTNLQHLEWNPTKISKVTPFYELGMQKNYNEDTCLITIRE